MSKQVPTPKNIFKKNKIKATIIIDWTKYEFDGDECQVNCVYLHWILTQLEFGFTFVFKIYLFITTILLIIISYR